jgi:hypothetical protein
MIPALQMIPSIGTFNALTVATLARTEAGSASSHATGVVSRYTEAQAARALSKVRAAAITRAPRSVSTRRVSNPRPELQPVRRYDLPSRDRPPDTGVMEMRIIGSKFFEQRPTIATSVGHPPPWSMLSEGWG